MTFALNDADIKQLLLFDSLNSLTKREQKFLDKFFFECKIASLNLKKAFKYLNTVDQCAQNAVLA